MRVLFREPMNQPLQLKDIEGTFEDFQELVGDLIEMVPMTDEIMCLCNDEAEMLGLKKNFYDDRHGWIFGTCVFTATRNREFASLSDKQIGYISEYIGFPVV
ncbi:DUF3846 domain-containing protein [Desulfosporosinus sp. SYSU MS00001]|uniref:DUF3846 domain-containing protein n=1 Tax=Desulfosporosinus sp. SYSU MS00001 TaxID=3416284 RepID=UPI003CFA82D2